LLNPGLYKARSRWKRVGDEPDNIGDGLKKSWAVRPLNWSDLDPISCESTREKWVRLLV